MLDRTLLVRYLRQRADLGERELFLDGLSAEELFAALAPGPRPGTSAPPAEGASGRAGEQRSAASRPSGRALLREVLAGAPEATAMAEASAALLPDPRAQPSPVSMGGPEASSHPPTRSLAQSARGRPDALMSPELRALAAQAAQCTACRLSAGRRTVVFGEGNPAAQLVIVGEAPGQEEDRTGRPFVGQAGKLLDLLLLSAGFPREQVYICNTLKCRPPQNRNPLPDELAACSRFLKGQLGAIQPKVVLAVGKFAAQSLVGSEESITRLRGRVFRYEGVPLVVSYHPAFLLRSPQWTRTAWEDFQLARKVLDDQA